MISPKISLLAKLKDMGSHASTPPPGTTAQGVPVPQGQDVSRKNPTETLVQLTRSGNVRTTFDPSLEFVAEQAGLYGDAALAEAHNQENKETPVS